MTITVVRHMDFHGVSRYYLSSLSSLPCLVLTLYVRVLKDQYYR